MIEEKVAIYFEKCKELANYLTRHPEVSGKEENSCAYLVGFLREQGYEVETPYAEMPYSFLAIPPKRKAAASKKAVFLCEYDALPEIGHACGHSLSCAASVLAGLAINEAYPDLPIRMDLMGTPGEECVGGKAIMTQNGGFDGYEFAAMIHMYDKNQTYFRVLASNDRYITFQGKASHASAAPQDGRNALNAARLFMDAMDMWRQHLPADVQLHGIVEHGGEAPNIVPDKVVLDYYFRAATMEHLKLVNEKAELCAKGAAIATDTTYEMQQRYPDYGEIFCNDYKDQFMRRLFEQTGRSCETPQFPAGSSDAGNVDMRIPVFHPMLAITEEGGEIALHDKRFAQILETPLAYAGLKDAAMILCSLAYELATHDEVLEQIQKDHKEYRA